MCGPHIRLCLFTFRSIASRQLNSLTTIHTLSWLGGVVVKHPLWVQEVLGSIPGSGKGFYVQLFLLLLLCFYFLSKNTLLVKRFAIPFAMFIYLVYLTYCKICDRLKRYKDTDLASLNCTILITIEQQDWYNIHKTFLSVWMMFSWNLCKTAYFQSFFVWERYQKHNNI